jgi:hypothetical protein
MEVKYLVLHHTAVSREKNSAQFEAVRNYHKSKGWGDIGYAYFIEPNGLLLKGRRDDIPQAHVLEDNMNYKSLGICLTGNFDIEDPTPAQLKTLSSLLINLRIKYNISRDKVNFHRDFAKYKSCPGNNFTRELLQKNMPMAELVRDKNTGQHYFVKNGSEGKQKVDSIGGVLTVIGREFGVRSLDGTTLDKIPDKNYFS